MADLTQSSQTTETTTPAYYTKYLSDLAGQGTTAANTAIGNAVGTGSAWNPTALQNQAFTDVSANVGSYIPGLTQAGQTFQTAGATDITGAADPYLTAGTTTSGLTQANPYLTAGTSSAAPLVADYMNPYTQNVVDQIRLANQQNIQQNLSPGITAGAVGGGQFGSKRGAEALALGISNADIGALTAQTGALQSGYAQALAAAQAQRAAQTQAGQTAGTLQNQYNTNQTTAGQVAGNMAAQEGQLLRDVGTGQAALAGQTQTAGLTDVNALATLGGQQQTIAQNKALAPLDILGKQASIMSGAQLPTTVTTQATGSPLSAIAGLGSLGVGLMTPATGTVNAANPTGVSPLDKLKSLLGYSTAAPATDNIISGTGTTQTGGSGGIGSGTTLGGADNVPAEGVAVDPSSGSGYSINGYPTYANGDPFP